MDEARVTARVEKETVRQLELLAYRHGLVRESGEPNVSAALRYVIDIGLQAASSHSVSHRIGERNEQQQA